MTALAWLAVVMIVLWGIVACLSVAQLRRFRRLRRLVK